MGKLYRILCQPSPNPFLATELSVPNQQGLAALTLPAASLSTLAPGRELNSDIISAYFALLGARFGAAQHILALSSFFYTQLEEKGDGHSQRWFKYLDPPGVQARNAVIIPVHLPGHWVCARVSFREKRIEVYDSLQSQSGQPDVCMTLRRWVSSLQVNCDDWTLIPRAHSPQQQNFFDCGVYTCMCARALMQGGEFVYDQSHMPYLRGQIAMEIVRQTIL
jgi:sentrin-specific protease 1